MNTPREFLAVYECETCGEEIEMSNCLVPHFTVGCEICGNPQRFLSQRIVHLSLEWDRIEE